MNLMLRPLLVISCLLAAACGGGASPDGGAMGTGGEKDGVAGLPSSPVAGPVATPGDSVPAGPLSATPTGCQPGYFCAGSAKRDISPSRAHIDGVTEERLGGATVLQKFHLGGFGFGPFEQAKLLASNSGGNFDERTCDPGFGSDTCVSNEAARRAFHNGVQGEERTYVRAFYLSVPGQGETLFVMFDAVGAGNLIQHGLRKAIADKTQIAPQNMIIGQTHSHAGADLQGLWGGVPQEWVRDFLYAGAANAADEAKRNSRSATLRYATGQNSDFNNYRRPRVQPDADADPNLSLLVAQDLVSNKPLGSLMQYAAHPTAIGAGSGGAAGRAVHADYIHGAMQKLEQTFGASALYYNGPIADASASGGPGGGMDDYENVRLRGNALAQAAINLYNNRATLIRPRLAITSREVTLPVTNPLFVAIGLGGAFNHYYDFAMLPFSSIPGIGEMAAAQQSNLPQLTPTARTLVTRLTLGGTTGSNRAEIVTMPGEATHTFGQYIRKLATTPNVMLFGLTQNSFGYILPEDEFSYVNPDGDAGFVLPFTGYEEFVSLGPMTAPLLRTQGYNLLFGQPQSAELPPSVAACQSGDVFKNGCILGRLAQYPDYVQKAYARTCRENGLNAGFCALLDPETPLYQPCLDQGLPASLCRAFNGPSNPPPAQSGPDYGGGLLGVVAEFMHDSNAAFFALLAGDFPGAGELMQTALRDLAAGLAALAAGDEDSVTALAAEAAAGAAAQDPDAVQQAQEDAGAVFGLDDDPVAVGQRSASANRQAEAVVLQGAQIAAWSVAPAQGAPYPYPSGVIYTAGFLPEQLEKNEGYHAHNGVILYPPAGTPQDPSVMGKPVARIAAYAYQNDRFNEIPVQVDQKFPFFLANSGSDFSVYSGTDEELTYEWDTERWSNPAGPSCNAVYGEGMRDPVTGLDADDEIVFMAQDAGAMAPLDAALPGDLDPAEALQQVIINDPLKPDDVSYVYLGLKRAGRSPAFADQQVYVKYQRDANADQWIDRRFFADNDPEKLGSSNTGYGPNRDGTVCMNGVPMAPASTDRFPRDGVTVTTDAYEWYASGRWMVRSIKIAKPEQTRDRAPGGVQYGPDLIDRWKGRAFQQSPDSTVSLVGFEDEQVNWEANSNLLGERGGPVRAIREVWGADSGTNVTKTETFYRDAVTYRYHVRVHPIPSDGLYTSWDYNRSAMVPAGNEPGGRYYTALRPQGVPVDGLNDDVGQMDQLGGFPAFFDAADPTFNLALAFDNWEQVSGKGNSGSLVYTFELKGATSVANPLVVPYYRDDACLDDGTGDDPVRRPYPGETSTDARVIAGYSAANGNKPYAQLSCAEKQGAHASHGVHYFFTHDSDNAFVMGKPNNEIDGQQWQFMVPTAQPQNLGETYANIARVPLRTTVLPRPSADSLQRSR